MSGDIWPGITVDIGDLCTHCGRSTAFGSQLFVNRIEIEWDTATLVLTGGDADVRISVEVDGYMCAECQLIKCDTVEGRLQ